MKNLSSDCRIRSAIRTFLFNFKYMETFFKNYFLKNIKIIKVSTNLCSV